MSAWNEQPIMASDIHSVVSYSMPQNLCSSELVPPMVAEL